MAIIQVNQMATPVKNWRIFLDQCFTVHIPLLTANSADTRVHIKGVTYTISVPSKQYLHQQELTSCWDVQLFDHNTKAKTTSAKK